MVFNKKKLSWQNFISIIFVGLVENIGRALTLTCLISIAAWLADKELEFNIWQIWGLCTIGFVALNLIVSTFKKTNINS